MQNTVSKAVSPQSYVSRFCIRSFLPLLSEIMLSHNPCGVCRIVCPPDDLLTLVNVSMGLNMRGNSEGFRGELKLKLNIWSAVQMLTGVLLASASES